MPLRHVPAAYASEGQGASPLCAAVDAGIFERYGLDVPLIVSGSATNVVKDLLSGKVLFGNLAAPALVRAVANGGDVVFIAGGVNQQFLVGAPGTKDVSELAGAAFGASQPGDLGDFLLEFTFREIVGAPGEFAYIGGSRERVHALLEGKIKASPLSPPLAVEAKLAGCPWLVDYAQYGLNFAIGGIAVRRNLLASDPDLVDTFLRAYVEGTKYYKMYRDFGIGIHEKYGGVSREVAEGTYDVTHSGFRESPDPATEGLQRLVDFWKETGTLPSTFKLSDVADSGPIRKVCGR